MGYPNLSSLAVCGRASPAWRNEELSDARHSNRSDPQAGKISTRTRRRRRLAPSARLHWLRLQMIFGNRVAKMKLVEQLTLVTLHTAHHGSTSPRFASTQRNHGSWPASTDFCNKSAKRRHDG